MAELTVGLIPLHLQHERYLLFCIGFLRNWHFYHHLLKKIRQRTSMTRTLLFVYTSPANKRHERTERPFLGKSQAGSME
jgi:hypothetical protein